MQHDAFIARKIKQTACLVKYRHQLYMILCKQCPLDVLFRAPILRASKFIVPAISSKITIKTFVKSTDI